MIYNFQIKGIDCGNCAAKIENKLRQNPMFSKVTMQFMLEKIEVETKEEDAYKIIQQIKQVANTIEEGVEVIAEYVPATTLHTQEQQQTTDREKLHQEKQHQHSQHCQPTRKPTMSYQISKFDYMIWTQIGVGILLLAVGVLSKVDWIIGLSYIVVGYKVLLRAVKNTFKGKIFDEHFLMAIATIGALSIGEYAEAVAVMLFYQVGEYFQSRAVNQSRRAIAELMDIKAEYAWVKEGLNWEKQSPDLIEVGQTILVKVGEKIPLDGIIVKGSSTIDASKLTGESIPQHKEEGDCVLSGSINTQQLIEVQVTQTLKNSTVSKVLALIESATSKKAKAEDFITKFATIYTPIVVVIAAMIAMIPSLITGDWQRWIYTSITFLVISCPCALVVSIPLSFFGGIGRASKQGILVKGSNYLEMLGTIDTVVMDKTGTITKGNFEVVAINPVEGTKEALLQQAAILERYSNHPIAQAIAKTVESIEVPVEAYTEIAGLGITGRVGELAYAVGNEKLMHSLEIDYKSSEEVGSIVHVAVGGIYKGSIVVADVIKEDTKQAVEQLKQRGIKKIIMLTGDREEVAQEVAKQVGVTEVYAECLPQDKVTQVEKLINEGSRVAFVGDGINDAPVMALAHIGMAMGGIGSDAAVEASDVVLMTDSLSLISQSMHIAHKTKQIVTQNIILALGTKLLVMILGILGIANMWLAVFADVGVSVLAILNAMRILVENKVEK